MSQGTCSRCGRSTVDCTPLEALAWVRETDDAGRTRWLCDRCARKHVRDIEGKLPGEYW